MATIALYKNKINGVGSLLDDIIKSSNNLNTQLGTLKNTLQGVDSNTCDLQATVDSISSSTKSEKEKVEDLKKLNRKLTEFIELTAKRDAASKAEIEKSKNDFYTKYKYLKPECEKPRLEKVAEAMKSTWEWCKEHWKEIALVLEVVVAIVCLFIPGLEEIGIGILAGMFIGSLCGAALGGLSGYAQYGVQGILPGVLQGAENGALIGGLCGGLGGAGALAGEAFGCSTLMTGIFSVSSKLSIGMMAFDLTALANDFQTRFKMDTGIDLGLIDPTIGGFISNLNHEAHNNPFYNTLQIVTAATAAFSGGYVRTAACFVAGTMVATANGFKAIESIKAGDLVLSANTETMQTDYKPVLETYIRNVDKLVHLTVNGEEIITTVDHPFYVNGQGFVNAVDLCIESELVDDSGNVLKVEQIFRETLHDETVKVYNFKVEDYHTYYVSNCGVLVHNRGYDNFEDMPRTGKPGSPKWKETVKALKKGNLKGKGNNYVTETKADALRLIEESRPDLPKQPTYTKNGARAKYYQEHPVEEGINFDRPHIKFEDWSEGKSGGEGHIFWEND